MEDIVVELSEAEMLQAAIVAVQRNVENIFAGRHHKFGAGSDNGWTMHIEGAAGEMAFAKWADRYWSGSLGNLKADDVGSVQVRTTSGHNNRLILHAEDPDDRRFVLLTGLAPRFIIRGWIWGRDAKQEKYWKDPAGGRPAFFVPQDDLRSMRRAQREEVAA